MVTSVINELGLSDQSQGEGAVTYLVLKLLADTSPTITGPNKFRAVLNYLKANYPSPALQIVERVFGSRAN